MSTNLLLLDHDYAVLSLSRFQAPVRTVIEIVKDIQVVEGLEGVLVAEEELAADLVTEQEFEASVADEEVPTGDLEDEEPMDGELVSEETMEGVLEP